MKWFLLKENHHYIVFQFENVFTDIRIFLTPKRGRGRLLFLFVFLEKKKIFSFLKLRVRNRSVMHSREFTS